MEENKTENFDEEKSTANETLDAQKESDTSELKDAETTISDDNDDGAFDVNKIASEEAFNDLLNGKTEEKTEDDEAGSEEETDETEEELDVPLATYAVDCDMCATKVFFELEDLDENGHLVCPNCEEEIEIDKDAIDYYLVNKPEQKDAPTYVVDCPSCEAFFHFDPEDIDEEENIICPECGGTVHIETEVLDAYMESDIEKEHKKKAKRKKILAIVLGVFAGIIAALAVVYFIGINDVVKVGKTKVDMNIYKSVYYCECAANYSGSGFDITKKPSKQEYTESDDYKTWDDFLKAQTLDSLKTYYSIYNAGQKAGYTLTKADNEAIDSTIKKIKSYADESKSSFEDFMNSNYGIKMTEKQIRPYLELSQYASSYYQSVMSKYVTEDSMEKLYKANPDTYDTVSFRYYYIAVSEAMPKDKALAAVKDIASAKTETEFHSKVKKYVSSDDSSNYKDANSTLVKDIACSNITDRPIADVITSAKSKKGVVTYGLASDGTYAEVAMLVTPRHKNSDTLKSAAVNEAASTNGQNYISGLTKNTNVKSGVGMLICDITF